jgi:hypothetical protein
VIVTSLNVVGGEPNKRITANVNKQLEEGHARNENRIIRQ